MHPFYFGDSANSLYGVSHPPLGQQFQESAILICNPLGHEYIRSHRALNQLAARLQHKGFFVLRFDYQGTGDSAGSFSDTTLTTLTTDIATAAEELKSLSGAQFVSAIGLRLGAMLAMLAHEQCRFRQLYLWDPVVSGKTFVEKLKSLREGFISSRYFFYQERNLADVDTDEYIGYSYSPLLLTELSEIQLQKTVEGIPPHTQICCTQDDDTLGQFLKARNIQSTICKLDDMGGWDNILMLETTLVPTKVLAWFEQVVDQ